MDEKILNILKLAEELSDEINGVLQSAQEYRDEVKEIEYLMIDILHILAGVNLNSKEIMQIGIKADNKLERRKILQNNINFLESVNEPLENIQNGLSTIILEGKKFFEQQKNYSFLTKEGFELLKNIPNYENRTSQNLGFNNLRCLKREEKKKRKEEKYLVRKDISVNLEINTTTIVEENSFIKKDKKKNDFHMQLKKENFYLVSPNGDKMVFDTFKDLFKFITDNKNINITSLDKNCFVRLTSIYKSQMKDNSLNKDKIRMMLLRNITNKPVI